MASRVNIHRLLGFDNNGQKLVKEIKCLYLPEKDVMIDPDEVKDGL